MIKDGKLRCEDCGSDHVSTQETEKRASHNTGMLVICNDCGMIETR